MRIKYRRPRGTVAQEAAMGALQGATILGVLFTLMGLYSLVVGNTVYDTIWPPLVAPLPGAMSASLALAGPLVSVAALATGLRIRDIVKRALPSDK